MGQFRQLLATRRRAAMGLSTGSRGVASLRELQQRAQELEAQNRAIGAPGIEQDKPGFLTRTIDVLSGFNYAIAGFADEMFQGNGLGSALARSTRELYSSARSLPLGQLLPEVKAEKEAFGKVLEDAGFGTVTLAEVLPVLEGTMLGNLGSRGGIGLALDVASDPLTYFTFGQGPIARKLLSSGIKRFSRPGSKLFSKELAAARKEMSEEGLFRFTRKNLDQRDVSLARQSRQSDVALFGDDVLEGATEEARESILREVAYRRSIAKYGEDAIADMGGIKWFGRNLVKGKDIRAVYSKFSQPVVDGIRRFEFGDDVLNFAEKTYHGTRKAIIGVFSKDERLAGLPKQTRRMMLGMARRFRKGQTLLAGRLATRATGSDWYNYLKNNPLKVRPIFDALESNAIRTLDEEAALVANGMADFFDEIGKDAVALNMITPEQFAAGGGRYIAHFWENVPEEFSEIWTRWTGQLETIANKHNKSRVYQSQREGMRVSQLLSLVTDAARKQGIAVKSSPELIPVEAIDQIVGKYIQWYTQGKTRRLFAQEAENLFGVELGELTGKNLTALFEGMTERNIATKVSEKIDSFLDDDDVTPLKKRRKKIEEVIEVTEAGGFQRTGETQEVVQRGRKMLVRQDRDRVANSKFALSLGEKQRENIRVALMDMSRRTGRTAEDRVVGTSDLGGPGRVQTKLKDIPGGFKAENKNAGEFIAGKMARGDQITDAEWVAAHKIVSDQKSTVMRNLNVEELDIAPARQVTPAEAVGRAADADILDMEERIARGLGETVTADSVLNPLNAAERRLIDSLSKEERREYFRRILEQMEGENQIVDFMRKYSDDYINDMPRLRTIAHGDSEAVLRRFDEVATTAVVDPITGRMEKMSDYVVRGGNALWGDNVKLVPRLIAEYIDSADPRLLRGRLAKDWKALQKSLDVIDWSNNWFKLGVYPMFPASGFRDAYSNVWFNSFRIGMNALNPRLMLQSIKILAHMEGSPATIRATNKALSALGFDPEHIVTKSGRRIRTDEAARQLQARHVTITAEEGLEVSEEFAKKKSVPRKVVSKVLKEAREPIDNISRVSLATQNLIDDLSFDDAAHEVGEYLFHYNELPGFAREFITRFIPFGRFTLKNTEFHFNMLRRNPGAVINRLKPFRGREDEDNQMVSFRAEGLKIGLARDGKTMTAITGIDLPTRNLDFYWRGSVSKTLRMAMGSLGPIFKAPIEAATETDLFTGSDNPRVRAELLGRFLDHSGAPQSLKNWLGYTKTLDGAGRPRYDVDRWSLGVQFLRGWMFSRVLSTSDRQFVKWADDKSIGPLMLDVMTGMRKENINFNDEQRMRFNERIRLLERASERRGGGRKFQRHYKPKNEQRVFQ